MIQYNLPESLKAIAPEHAVKLAGWPDSKENITNLPGLYAFWWLGGADKLDGTQEVQFKGRNVQQLDDDGNVIGNHEVHTSNFVMDDNLRLYDTKEICLYVGKSTNIRGRICQHLRPGLRSSAKFAHVNYGKENQREVCTYTEAVSTICKRKGDTACQFRAGMEYVLRQEVLDSPQGRDSTLVWDSIMANVRVSFVPVVDSEDEDLANDAFKRRFYWEDLLIGVLQPWFNLDGER
jgi:hypothetical protein